MAKIGEREQRGQLPALGALEAHLINARHLLGEVLEVKQGQGSSLKPGDKVVLKPSEKLHDGAAVSVAAK